MKFASTLGCFHDLPSIDSSAQGALPFIIIARNTRFVTQFWKTAIHHTSLGTSLICHEIKLCHICHSLYHVLSRVLSPRNFDSISRWRRYDSSFLSMNNSQARTTEKKSDLARQLSTYSFAIIRMIPSFFSTNGSFRESCLVVQIVRNATNIIEVETTRIRRDEVELFRVLMPVLSKCSNRLIRNFPYGEPLQDEPSNSMTTWFAAALYLILN